MIFIFLVFFFFFSPWSIVHSPLSSLQAGMILPAQTVKLDQLTHQAELVFKGTCEEKYADTVLHPKTKKEIPLSVYRFKVEEVLKGNLKEGGIVEVKQVDVPTRREALELRVGYSSSEKFETGKSYLLFLSAPNRFGVRSVLGGGYGKYSVTKDERGEENLENPFGIPEVPVEKQTGGASKSVGSKEKVFLKTAPYKDFAEEIKASLKR